MIRRFFWNFWTSFMGWGLVKMAPAQFLYYPVLFGVPIYTFSVMQSGTFENKIEIIHRQHLL